MSDREPNIVRLASYIQNRISERGAADFAYRKRRIFVVSHTALNRELPGMLVATDRGASMYFDHTVPMNETTFIAGGFDLQTSRLLYRVFDAIRGKQRITETSKVRKLHGT